MTDGEAADGARTPRRSAKVIVVDRSGDVLLFRGMDPQRPADAAWWFPPGGGVESGESDEQAALRELREETGLLVDDVGSPIGTRRATFTFEGQVWDSDEVYFLIRVDRFEVDDAGWTQVEFRSILGYRWWSRQELVTTTETVYPEQLVSMLQEHVDEASEEVEGRMMADPASLPLRRYRGFIADSARWERFNFRPDDVVITTPSKCGTTWMQTIVGMLLLDRVDLGAPISTISPWLDMLVRTDDEVFGPLEDQSNRRFVKTHTPLDGIPRHPSVTYIAVVRHPLDVALSDLDHDENQRGDRVVELRIAASGSPPADVRETEPWPDDPGDYLRWFIDNDEPPVGSGPHGLDDYCQQVRTYWDARRERNVHLFHYADMWADLDGEMRRVADALGVPFDEERWPAFVEAAGLESMRSRAADTAPEAHLDLWVSPERFFRSGGTRDWASLLGPDDIAHFDERLRLLAGDAADWAVQGRSALHL